MTRQEANQAASKEMHEFQMETLFPSTLMPKDYYTRLKNAFLDLSAGELQTNTETYASLCAKQDHYNLWQIGNQVRILRSVKPSKLGFTAIADYVDFIKELDSLMEKFSEIVSPKQQELKDKYDKLIEEEDQQPAEEPKGTVIPFTSN